jgi:hypothetical protein
MAAACLHGVFTLAATLHTTNGKMPAACPHGVSRLLLLCTPPMERCLRLVLMEFSRSLLSLNYTKAFESVEQLLSDQLSFSNEREDSVRASRRHLQYLAEGLI